MKDNLSYLDNDDIPFAILYNYICQNMNNVL